LEAFGERCESSLNRCPSFAIKDFARRILKPPNAKDSSQTRLDGTATPQLEVDPLFQLVLAGTAVGQFGLEQKSIRRNGDLGASLRYLADDDRADVLVAWLYRSNS
jgi:hypothetical protein